MHFEVSIPDWAVTEMAALPTHIESVEDRMRAVIRFSRLNIEHETGGPFAAGIFERDSGKLVVIGVNRVVPSHNSTAHAEVVTLAMAQTLLGTFDLGGVGMPAYQLVVNWRPCVMCYGAVHWSGISSLVIAGSGPELEAITGFDEGPIHPEWRTQFENYGIEVVDGLLTEAAVAVFQQFADSGALVYNGSAGRDASE